MAGRWSFKRILIVIMLTLLVGLAGAGWYFWSKHLDPLLQANRAQRARGLDFGESADARACLLKTFEFYGEAPGFKQGLLSRVFLDACLRTSSPSPGFCDGVPAKNEIVASAKWRVSVCGREGHADDSCHMLLEPVQEHCDGVGAGAYDQEDADGGADAGSGDEGASGTDAPGADAGAADPGGEGS